MPILFKKFTLSFFAFLILFFSVAPNFLYVKAASIPTWYNQGIGDWFNKVYDTENPSEIFGERYTAAQVQWVLYSTVAVTLNLFLGTDVGGIVICALAQKTDQGAGGSCWADAFENLYTKNIQTPNLAQKPNKSISGFIFSDRSMSGISYTKNIINKFGSIPSAKAQVGYGYDALKPIQGMWTASRDVAFSFFVLVTIIFAFMIMFRVKINPQTVVSIQSAIPKIVIALLEVTFSYAIAGFLIDLMYVVIAVFSTAFAKFTPVTVDPVAIFNTMVYGQSFGTVQVGAIGLLTLLALPLMVALLIGVIVLLAGTGGGLVFWILFLPVLIAFAMVLWISIKTMWGMLKAFVNIILLTIFAPFQIALGILIPNFGFGAWVKSYISHLSVFVITGVIIMFSVLFMIQGVIMAASGISGGSSIARSLLAPLNTILPGIQSLSYVINTSPWPPLLGSGNGLWIGILFLGVSFVLYTMIPKATELVQSFLSGKPFAYGTAIGEAWGPIKMAGQGGLGYGFAKYEERRARDAQRAKIQYEPAAITQALRTLGIISK